MKVKIEWYSEQERTDFLTPLVPKVKEGETPITLDEVEAAVVDELEAYTRLKENGRSSNVMKAMLRVATRSQLMQEARQAQDAKRKTSQEIKQPKSKQAKE